MAHSDRVPVDLGDRSYQVLITDEGFDGLGTALAERFAPGVVCVVSNPVVAPLYLAEASDSLARAGFTVRALTIADGEQHKDAATWLALVDALLAAGLDRRTPVIALGGGVTGDLVGFAAAAVLRGVPFVQVPTTLLAMVDASVGGKTGVNLPQGKNLLGAFHQPSLVFANTRTLRSLPDAEWRCGMGEALKHGVIRDAALVDWMLAEASGLAAREPTLTAELVGRCCRIKAAVVVADEREAGVRAILNFGHTFGHALETAIGYGHIRHGEAVALGMLLESRLAVRLGWCPDSAFPSQLLGIARALHLPTDLTPWADLVPGDLGAQIEAALRMDKKTVRGTLTLVAPIAMGEVRLVTAPFSTIFSTIGRSLEMILSWENEP
jgi:3-dehydroquinate synthase